MSSSETVCAEEGHRGFVEQNNTQSDSLPVNGPGEQENSIVLKFPFAIDGIDRISRIGTTVERMQEHVSFALPFDLELFIKDAVLASKEFDKGWAVYVFEFQSLDAAIEWMKEKHVEVEMRQRNGDLHAIQKEMDDFMLSYEEGERRKRKKKVVVDDEGFTYYE